MYILVWGTVLEFFDRNLVSGEFWCWHPHAKIPKFIILTYRRHFADMLPTFPVKTVPIQPLLMEI
jgi:hypothetical protein